MKRGGLWLVGAVVVVPALFWGVSSSPSSTSVTTYRVEVEDFRREVAAEGVLRAVKATPIAPPSDAPGPMRIAWLAQDGSRVAADEVVIRFDPSELEKQQLDAEGEVAQADLKLERHWAETGSRIRNLGRDAEAAGLELEISREFESRDEALYSRFDIIESELDSELAEERKRHADSSRVSEERLASAQEGLHRLERSKAERTLTRARTGLQGLEVRAPHGGVLVVQRDWKGDPVRVGDTVWGRQTLMEIPDLSEMEAEVFVLEADAGGLEPGRRARLVIEAFPDLVFEAEVARVASFAKPRLRGSPVQYFSAVLKLAETDAERMRPGQRVVAHLLLDDLPGVPVVPRQAVFDRDGERVVYRRDSEGDFSPVVIEVAAAGAGRVAVAEGLSEGDVLALADPTAAGSTRSSGAGASSGPVLPGSAP